MSDSVPIIIVSEFGNFCKHVYTLYSYDRWEKLNMLWEYEKTNILPWNHLLDRNSLADFPLFIAFPLFRVRFSPRWRGVQAIAQTDGFPQCAGCGGGGTTQVFRRQTQARVARRGLTVPRPGGTRPEVLMYDHSFTLGSQITPHFSQIGTKWDKSGTF